MILVIDNYDSFTYNLVQYLGELGEDLEVIRNNKTTIDGIRALSPERIIISPGPGTPASAGISKEVIKSLGPEVPVLGVCLGHQCIAEVYGAKIVRAGNIMHGKVSSIYHNGEGLFKGVQSPFTATRYHSLIADAKTVNPPLKVTAWTLEKEIMGLRHAEYPVFGVQFHPESILTEDGKNLLGNFLKIAPVEN